MFLQLLFNGVALGSLYALIASGFGLIYNTTRIFHLAYGAIFVFSAYCLYTFFSLLGFPFFIALLLTIILSALIGLMIDKIVYRPLERQRASPMVIVISSLAIYIVLANSIAVIYGNEPRILIPTLPPKISFGQITISVFQMAEILTFAIVFFGLIIFLKRTLLGKMIKAMRDNSQLLSVIGVNTFKLRMVIFGLGSALGALSASLYALEGVVEPYMGLSYLLIGIVAVIIGGVGSFEGACLGGLLLGMLINIVVWKISATWVDSFVFALLILCLLIRPRGILGPKKRVEEL